MSPIKWQYRLDELRRQEDIRYAEQHELGRLAKQRIMHRSRRNLGNIFKPALFRLGQQLEAVGNNLQVRYGDLKPRPNE